MLDETYSPYAYWKLLSVRLRSYACIESYRQSFLSGLLSAHESLPRKCAMTTDGIVRAPLWKDLYRQAMLETDLAKLPSIIADAHKALLDRIEETLTKSVSAEREELSDALNGLRCLRQELNVRPRQTDGDGPVLRKTG